MGDRCRRHRSALGVVLDVAVHPIDRSGEERAQEEREQHPILDDDIGGQRKEIEADVLVVERVVRAIGHVIEELQEDAPVVDLSPGDKHSEEAGAAGDDEGPRQPMAHEFQQVRRRRNARAFPLEVGGALHPRRPGKTGRERSVHPKDDGGRHEDDEKNFGFGADGRPEDLQIADRGKPQPIDQEVAREPQQDQADRADDASYDERKHGASPRLPPPGSGDPDRHGLMIAEAGDAHLPIRSRIRLQFRTYCCLAANRREGPQAAMMVVLS